MNEEWRNESVTKGAAYDALANLDQYAELGECLDTIKDLPSAQPQRMKGRWMRKNDGVYCSACYKGWDFMTGVPAEVETEYKFCPNCGADMRGEQDEID